jgi:hypothetical protein
MFISGVDPELLQIRLLNSTRFQFYLCSHPSAQLRLLYPSSASAVLPTFEIEEEPEDPVP